jgi:uncharacterized membrane protein YeaQ/YmgE (transglycosylase-associated protein family)
MSLLDFFILLVIAGICGSLGQAIAGYNAGGCLVSIALGFIGALIGLYLQRHLDLPILWDPMGFPVVWAIAGSALFVALISLLRRPRRPAD